MKLKYVIILLLYYLLVVLPHEHVGAFLASIFLPGSRVRYNGIMLTILSGALLGVGLWLIKKVAAKDRKLVFGYSTVTLLLIVICINVLFVLNVEAIHFVQYAIFAIICFQISNSYFKTMFWSMVAGAIDELYQYVYLAPKRVDYYDFNDVLINGVGAGIGLIIIRSIEKESRLFKWKDFTSSLEFYFTLAFFAFLAIGFLFGFISYGPDSSASFCFIKDEQLGFWKEEVRHNLKFHVVKPLEGLFFIVVILTFYSCLQRGSIDISTLSSNN